MRKDRGGASARAGRLISRVVAVFVLVAATMPAIAGTSYAWKVPDTLHEMVSGGRWGGGVLGPGLVQRALPFAATDLGLIWRGTASPPRIRTSRDGSRWSEWVHPTESEDMYDPGTGTHYSSLVAGKRARWAQIAPSAGVIQGSLNLAVINTLDGPLRTVRSNRTAIAATPQPPVLSRRSWGADESMRTGQPAFSPLRKIFVHHTVTPNNADPAATIRAMYAYHVRGRGWEDIGYNFLIDWKGNIYEGRYSRPYASGQQPTGEDANGNGVVGAHTEGHNRGSVGIAYLGNTERQGPPEAAVDALVRLIAWKAGNHKIDPSGSDSYPGEAGRQESFPNVSGHRDAPTASTECPGERLHAMLPSIRQRAKQLVGASGSAPAGPISGILGPILNAPAPGAGDAVTGVLKGIGL